MKFQTIGTANAVVFAVVLMAGTPILSFSFSNARIPKVLKDTPCCRQRQRLDALSSEYLENDLLAIASDTTTKDEEESKPRLCVVRPDGTVSPLCQREDDVETDLFIDPREYSNNIWAEVTDEQVTGTYGEGWYGQRPVPSLGGGPGYGAEADEIWSIDESIIEQIRSDGVDLPILDMGIAHGEKARAGAF